MAAALLASLAVPLDEADLALSASASADLVASRRGALLERADAARICHCSTQQ